MCCISDFLSVCCEWVITIHPCLHINFCGDIQINNSGVQFFFWVISNRIDCFTAFLLSSNNKIIVSWVAPFWIINHLFDCLKNGYLPNLKNLYFILLIIPHRKRPKEFRFIYTIFPHPWLVGWNSLIWFNPMRYALTVFFCPILNTFYSRAFSERS